MRVLLNGINALSAGGRAVVSSVVPCIVKIAPEITFDLVLPAGQGYDDWHSTDNLNVHLIQCPTNRVLGRLGDLYLHVARWCRKYQADICFTLVDIGPIRLKIPHVVLLQQALIVYREWVFEQLWTAGERWKFRYTRWHFGRMAPHCAAITVQSPVMAARVQELYHVPRDKLWVVPSALPTQTRPVIASPGPHPQMMAVNKPCRLLFLATGYEHKNHIILPELGRELRHRKLVNMVHLFVTLDPNRRAYERDLLTSLATETDWVTNLGRLSAAMVPEAYVAANALFMPTLVESFGLIYLEAMAYDCPILTSDRDFARWLCGDLALYFEPTDPVSVADTIEWFAHAGVPDQYPEQARQRLAEFPASWEPVARQYLEMLRRGGVHGHQSCNQSNSSSMATN